MHATATVRKNAIEHIVFFNYIKIYRNSYSSKFFITLPRNTKRTRLQNEGALFTVSFEFFALFSSRRREE